MRVFGSYSVAIEFTRAAMCALLRRRRGAEKKCPPNARARMAPTTGAHGGRGARMLLLVVCGWATVHADNKECHLKGYSHFWGFDTSPRYKFDFPGKGLYTFVKTDSLEVQGFMCDVLKGGTPVRARTASRRAGDACAPRRSSAAASRVRPRAGRWCRSPQASDHQSLRLGAERVCTR